MRMRIIWGAKVLKSGVMRMRYKGDSGDMRMRMTLSGYGSTLLEHTVIKEKIKFSVKKLLHLILRIIAIFCA